MRLLRLAILWLIIFFAFWAMESKWFTFAEDVVQIGGPFGGIDSDSHPLVLKKGDAQISLNVRTDDSGILTQRSGLVLFSTEPVSQMWYFSHSNGTNYLIGRVGGLLKATAGSGVFDILVSTVSDVRVAGTSLGDRFYFSNSADGYKYWDLGAAVTVDSLLKFTVLTTHKGRIFASGIASEPRSVYISRLYAGDDFDLVPFTEETNADPAIIQVEGSQNEPITAFYPWENLMWFKNNSFGAIYGARTKEFSSILYSNNIGTAYADSIQNCNGELRFYTSDRRVVGFDLSRIRILSEKVEDTEFQSIVQGGYESNFSILSSSVDFGQGTFFSGVSSSAVIGSVSFASNTAFRADFDVISDSVGWANVDNENTSNGSHPEIFYIDGSGSLYSKYPYTLNDGFSDWVPFKNGNGAKTGLFHYVSQWNSNPGAMKYFGFLSGSPVFSECVGYNGYRLAVLYSSAVSIGPTLQISSFTIRLESVSGDGLNCTSEVLISSIMAGSFGIGDTGIGVHRNSDGRIVVYRNLGNRIVTQLHPFDSSHSIIGSTIHVKDVSNANVTSYGIEPCPTENWLGFCITPNTYPDKIALNLYQQIGEGVENSTYITKAIDLRGNISNFTSFAVSDENLSPTGGIAYKIYVDSDTNINILDPSTYLDSESISDESVPSLSTGNYAFIAAFFDRSSATWSQSINEIFLGWETGNNSSVPSVWSDGRYKIGVDTNSSGLNNVVYEYDKNENWQKHSIAASAFLNFNGEYLVSNGDGIFYLDRGYSDNGQPINSFFRTRSESLGNIDKRKTFNFLQMVTKNSNSDLAVDYMVDGDTNTIRLSSYTMNSRVGTQNFKMPFSAEKLKSGHDISFHFIVSSTEPWGIINSNIYFDVEPEPLE